MWPPPDSASKSLMRRTLHPPPLLVVQHAGSDDDKQSSPCNQRQLASKGGSPRFNKRSPRKAEFQLLLFPWRVLRPLLITLVAWLVLVVIIGSSYSYHTRLMRGVYNGSDQLQPQGVFFVFPSDRLLFDDAMFSQSRMQRASRPWIELLPKITPLTEPQYSNIKYRSGRWANRTKLAAWRIRSNDDELHHKERARFLKKLDKETDEKDISYSDPGRYDHYEERDYPRPDGCYRPKWSYEQHSACNTVHEKVTMERQFPNALQHYETEYLGEGNFRASFRFTPVDDSVSDDVFVLKQIRLHKRRNYNAFTYDQIQIEELGFMHTQASPLTTNMYARCGTSVVVESGQQIRYALYPVEDNFNQKRIDKVQADKVVPFNKLTLEQKLKTALQMAEALALLHGNEEGVLVNDDVQIDQWLLGSDGNLKLNDFNNAVVLKWNPTNETYCDFRVCYGYIYRSPQEIKYRYTDESADVFAMGLILYTILTGFMPFYERHDWEASIKALKHGETPFIDPRYRNNSLIENRLVSIMEPTWEYYIKDRANIFQVVQGLRDAVGEYETQHPGVCIRDVDLSNLPTLDDYTVAKEDFITRLKGLRDAQRL